MEQSKQKSLYLFILFFIFSLYLNTGISAQNNMLLSLKKNCKSDTALITQVHLYYKNIRYANNDSAGWAVNEILHLAKKSKEKKYILTSWMDAVDYYSFIQKYELALAYSDSAFALANELNDKVSICQLYNLTGIIYSDQAEYGKSIDIYNKELTLAKSFNFRSAISQAYSNIGVSYYYMADYSKAIDYYLKALKILEEDKDSSKVSALLSNLAVFYQSKKQFDKAYEILQKSLSYCNPNDLSFLANTLSNISVNFNYMADYDKAMEYMDKTIEIQEKMNDKRGLATSYNNIAGIHTKLKNFDLAIVNVKKAIELSEQANIPVETSHYTRALAICYLNLKNYKPALENALKSTKIAREQNIRKTVVENYSLIAEIYYNLKDFRQSADYLFKYRALNDTLVAEEFEKSIAEMDAKYQSQKKQKEIELLTKDKKLKDTEFKQQRTQRNALIAGLVLFLLLIIVVARSYFQKKKDNKLLTLRNEEIMQQKEEISAQRDEIGIQRDLVVKQKEHIEEIHLEVSQSIDYATRIQSAILPEIAILENITSEYFVLFRPKDKVSGDFYWWAEIEGHTIITVADCTGHGVPGAFMSMLGISFLREIVMKEYITSPELILKKLRKEIIHALKQKGESGEQKDGMDMALVSINHSTREIDFAGANNPCWIVTSKLEEVASNEYQANGQKPIAKSQLLELKPDKMPVAIYEDMKPYTNHHYQIQKGDCIYLMSDGYEDQFGGPANKKFKSKQLKELLVTVNKMPMNSQLEIIEKAFMEWKGNYEQIDDVTILGIRM